MGNNNKLYVDYSGGKFELWFYKNGKRKFVDGFFWDYSSVELYYNKSPFVGIVLTTEAKEWKKIKS